jgi:hypothetical protein
MVAMKVERTLGAESSDKNGLGERFISLPSGQSPSCHTDFRYFVRVPWIQQTDVDQAEGLLARIYHDALKRAGRVWRIVKIQSLNPPQLRAGLGLYASLMHRDSALTPRLRETLAVVVSRANDCFY